MSADPDFLLTTHQPGWLATLDVPLMVSHTRLRRRKTFPRALAPWACDSGGFTELQHHGQFQTAPRVYADAVRRYADQIGQLRWAAIQDWMCEPIVIAGGVAAGQRFVGTALDVAEHQRRTVRSYLDLCDLAPELPWLPVVQGYSRDDYLRCVDRYDQAGVDLHAAKTVGLGSVCRRQHTPEIELIVRTLHAEGLRLHGFGVKADGFDRYSFGLVSADSLAWSDAARRAGKPLPGCQHPRSGKTCANCPRYALLWRARLLRRWTGNEQLTLEGMP